MGSDGWSGCHGGQLTELSIVELGEAFQAQIAPADSPFVGLLEPIGHVPPAEAETRYYDNLEDTALAA